MKKWISFLLILSMLLCSINGAFAEEEKLPAGSIPEAGFSGMNDPNLLRYAEDVIYDSLVTELNSEEYFVENVSAIYISQEYIDELAYNSRANIYFGYTLQEISEQFQGKKYVFTLGEDGNTVVTEFEEYDDTYDRVLKNVAIGTGVILVCVTVSSVTAGAGLPAVSMIFAVSAKNGTVMALSSGALGGISAGIITGVQTGDMDEALKAAALTGSEGFKWGAISGAIGGTVTETKKYQAAMRSLKGVELNGLTVQQAAMIQMESKYPVEIIKQFKNMEQYKACRQMGLESGIIDGKMALIKKVDLDTPLDEFGTTNRSLIGKGNSPIDIKTREKIELHHLGQSKESPLVTLTTSDHRIGDNYKLWHEVGLSSDAHANNAQWQKQVRSFWEQYVKMMDESALAA